jgi:hypothetical protein
MAHATFHVGDLTAVIGDNEAYPGHRAGYNGIHRLTHRTNPHSLFTVAGLNLEHIFDGDQDLRGNIKVLFEPRNFPMTLTKLSDSEAELHRAETPTFHLESWTRFKLVPPHYIDITFRCTPRQHVFRYGYIGLFWASYIDAPENKSIYFRDDKGWVQLCTQGHTNQSTVVPVGNTIDLKFTPKTRQMLYNNLSPLRYSDPFYYGLFGTHQYLLMFDRTEGIRFAHSPSAGRPPSATEVAWDWQFIIATYDVLREYGYRARMVYRERCSRDEVVKEFCTWRAALERERR